MTIFTLLLKPNAHAHSLKEALNAWHIRVQLLEVRHRLSVVTTFVNLNRLLPVVLHSTVSQMQKIGTLNLHESRRIINGRQQDQQIIGYESETWPKLVM